MPKICKKCNKNFPYQIKIEGKVRNLGSRKYCLECSPFGKHNTRTIEVSKTTKICRCCLVEKKIDDFYFKTDGYAYCYCKICMNTKRRDYFRNIKKQSIQYLGGKCELCAYDKCNDALEFHHRIPEEKEYSISSYKSTNFEKLKLELNKCDLLCANCHREVHSESN